MKKLSSGSLAVTFCGCFLGAGFVSGQELWQFFGAFGIWGFLGLAVAMVLFFASGVLIVRTSAISKTEELDKLVIPWHIPWVRALVGGTVTFFMFGIWVIMAAGADSLVHDLTGLPYGFGRGILCLLVALVALVGMRGMVAVFAWLVPLLTLVAVAIGIIALVQYGIPTRFEVAPQENPMLSNWLLAAVSYVAYNVACSIGMLSPLSQGAEKKVVYRGIALGVLLLLAIAGAILLAIIAVPGVLAGELPMWEVAQKISPLLGTVYGILLFGGMFGAAQGCAIATFTYGEQKAPRLKKYHIIVVFVVSFVAYLSSGFGFGTLVGILYPIFGYVSLGIMACLIIHRFQLRR